MSDTDPGAGPAPIDDPTAAEVERLRAERDALAHEVEELTAPRKRRLRRGIVGVLVALSCLLVVLSTTVVWTHRTILNTETFVGTVGPVFQLPGVDSAVAVRATDQLFDELHLQARLREALPPRVSFAAGPITNATEGYVSDQVAKVLGSERFQTVWIHTAHQYPPDGRRRAAGQADADRLHGQGLHRPQHRSGDQQRPRFGVRSGLEPHRHGRSPCRPSRRPSPPSRPSTGSPRRSA